MKIARLSVLACAVALSGLAEAQYTLEASLTEQQFLPGQLCCGNGSGNGTFELDPVANTLRFDILEFVDISPEDAAHFHLAAAGQVDPLVRFTLPPGAHKVGVWNYPESLEQSILQGFAYVDVHTLEGPGSLRGQILLQGVPALPPLGVVVLVVLAVGGGAVLIRRTR